MAVDFELENLREDIHLDLNNLDAEVQKQAGLYQFWADQLSESKRETALADIALKVKLGELEKDWRKDGLPSGNKATEGSVKAELEAHPEVQECRRNLAEAYYRQGLRESTTRALDHKKAQIDNAVRLWSNGYYQDPKNEGAGDNAGDTIRKGLRRRTPKEEES